MNLSARLICTASVLALALGGAFIHAQASGSATGGVFSLTGQVVGAGGSAAGGALTLTGRVVQPAGGRSTGGGFALTGGAFGVFAPLIPTRPIITIAPSADRAAVLTWPPGATAFALEFSPVVGPGALWQPVTPQPAGSTLNSPCLQPARFFRLRKP